MTYEELLIKTMIEDGQLYIWIEDSELWRPIYKIRNGFSNTFIKEWKAIREALRKSDYFYIDSYKTLSGGGNKDEVSIYIADSKGKRDVLEASGAETVLVSLALRAAMAHLLSLRMGSSVELFIIDEGMGALDDENIVVIKNMFKKLGDIFNKVLFITHVSELKDIAQSVIEVTSNSKVSTFKVIEAKDNE